MGVGELEVASKAGRYRGGRLLDSLRQHGVAPGDVTDVAFTQLRFDHAGWATSMGRAVFANAPYRVHRAGRADFADSRDAGPGAVRKLSPSTGRARVFGQE